MLQASVQQNTNWELPDIQAGLRKGRGTRDQIANIRLDHSRNKKIPGKHLLLFYWLRQSLWLCGSQQTGKFLKRQEYQTTLPASWENCMWAKKQHLEWDMEQLTGSKLGKEYDKAIYCQSAYLSYMQSILREMLGWMKHKLESRFLGKISTTSYMQMIPL